MDSTRRTQRTNEELDDLAIADAVGSFVAVKQRDWTRRQKNQMIPFVMRQVDMARAAGKTPDVARIIEDAFARGHVPFPELS